MPNQADIQFLHLRDENNIPYATIAFKTIHPEASDTKVLVRCAYSVAASCDNFSYKAGRNIAKQRLLNSAATRWQFTLNVPKSATLKERDTAVLTVALSAVRKPGPHKKTA